MVTVSLLYPSVGVHTIFKGDPAAAVWPIVGAVRTSKPFVCAKAVEAKAKAAAEINE